MVDVLQDFNGGNPADSWDSPPDYTEHVPSAVGTFTTFSFNDCLAASANYSAVQCVGAIGPLAPGSHDNSLSTPISGLDGQYLAESFQFTFNIAPGAPTGSGDSVTASAIPEPAQVMPVALALGTFAGAFFIRKRSAKGTSVIS
jgi:hypothetical protein